MPTNARITIAKVHFYGADAVWALTLHLCAWNCVVTADDATGIGVADDFLFAPLGTGIREGLILIFG